MSENSHAQLIAQMHEVTKIYGKGSAQVNALAGVSLDLRKGEFTAIMGPSGSGKSTLLHTLVGLDTVTSGEVTVENRRLSSLSDEELTRLRRDRIGFVFQAFNLIPTLDAQSNILLPLKLAGAKVDENWFTQIVEALGIRQRLGHRPAELSGGQQQRVAVARALVTKPALIAADEPTGNLDSVSSREVLALLRQAVDVLGQTVVMVTHDVHAAAQADRVLVMKDGLVVADLSHPTPEALGEVA